MYSIDPQGDAAFGIWSERSTIADCLNMMNLPLMAEKALDFKTPRKIIDDFLTIIKREAAIAKRHDVLEILHFAGLVYG